MSYFVVLLCGFRINGWINSFSLSLSALLMNKANTMVSLVTKTSLLICNMSTPATQDIASTFLLKAKQEVTLHSDV